ncbi:MAG TPA: YbaN family protein, partial [Blastocatellia bacterium]|nr:YbaN family protein [Blastocatellia bacterium]
LMNNRYLGQYIRNFQEKRGMPVSAKVISLVLLWASLAVSIYRVDAPWLKATLAVTGVGVTALILKIKTLRERVQ